MACKCGIRTKLVGDGCTECNPELAMHYEKAKIPDGIRELVIDLEGLSESMHDDLSVARDAALLIREYQKLLAESLEWNWLDEDAPVELRDKMLMFCDI